MKSQLEDITAKTKSLQRECYFLAQDRKRKKIVVQRLQSELEEDKRRKALQKQITAKIKEKVII